MLPLILRYGYLAALFFITCVFCFALALCHFFSTYFLLAETSIINGVSQKLLDRFDSMAVELGYLKFAPVASRTLDDIIELESKRHGISSVLVRAVMKCESGGSPDALSSKGAIGHMQIISSNAARCGIAKYQLHNPADNIACGVQILSENIRNNGSNVIAGLEEYLGGPRCVGNHCSKESVPYINCIVGAMAGVGRR